MPLFCLFCRDKRGREQYCIMLCTLRRLRQLVRLRHGFSDPAEYGRVVMTAQSGEPGVAVREMLKERYNFDLENCAFNRVRNG